MRFSSLVMFGCLIISEWVTSYFGKDLYRPLGLRIWCHKDISELISWFFLLSPSKSNVEIQGLGYLLPASFPLLVEYSGPLWPTIPGIVWPRDSGNGLTHLFRESFDPPFGAGADNIPELIWPTQGGNSGNGLTHLWAIGIWCKHAPLLVHCQSSSKTKGSFYFAQLYSEVFDTVWNLFHFCPPVSHVLTKG